jgi:hypothetical protein
MKIHYVPTALLVGSAVLIALVGLVLMLKGRAVRRSATGFHERAVPVTATEAIEAVTLTQVPDPPPRVGAEIEVAYDPDRPERVDVAATEDGAQGAGRTWILLGKLVLLLAAGVLAGWLVLVVVVWSS